MLLCACGVETAGSAATAGAIKAKEVEQARQTEAQVKARLDQTLKQSHQRLEQADAAASRP